MTSRDPSTSSDRRRPSGSARNSHDGLDKVELSDLDASPPPLPVEQDLMQLARLGELRSIQKLFDSGRYNARSADEQGITALHWAAINGHQALCHFLLQSGADVNARGGDAQATPVLWASKRCHLSVISLLLANGADPLLCDDQGYNLLHSATLDGNVFQLVLLLHQPDIPIDVTDTQGHTSLMWAAYKGFPACLEILLRYGADVHAVDQSGFSALHWALVRGNGACIQKLVAHGSDRFLRSFLQADQTQGDTPAETAAKMKSTRQWHKALVDSGFDENGSPLTFPIPGVHDRRGFISRFFFILPFFMGGLQLWMLANMLVWIAIPGVLLVGYALQFGAQQLLRWAPADMKQMHKTPFLAGIFAASLFWVGERYFFAILPYTFRTNFLLNACFLCAYSLCTYFYVMTMTADPGFIPKGGSRGQIKKTIDDLVEQSALNETYFCTTCMIRKPLRSKHCRRCGRCVAREDHHCPWVDNCVAVNNHKHFILYVLNLIIGLILMIRLTFAYLNVLPTPAASELHCAILSDEYCAEFSKDPLTVVTSMWGALQLTWTLMLLFVQLTQAARNVTTFETMRSRTQTGLLATAVTTGALSADGAQVDAAGAGPTAHDHTHGSGQPYGAPSPAVPQPPKKIRKTDGCLSRWSNILGVDAFLTIAFQGYNGSRSGSRHDAAHGRRAAATNPFSRGIVHNCQDFWLDGPIFGRKEDACRARLGGQEVSYASMYDVPRSGMAYRGDYEQVATHDVEEV